MVLLVSIHSFLYDDDYNYVLACLCRFTFSCCRNIVCSLFIHFFLSKLELYHVV